MASLAYLPANEQPASGGIANYLSRTPDNILTTTTGQAGRTNNATSGYNTSNPSLPNGIMDMINQGVWRATDAAKQSPYDYLNHQTAGMDPSYWAQVGNKFSSVADYRPQMTDAQRVGAQQIGAGAVGHWDGIRPESVMPAANVQAGQVGHWDGVRSQGVDATTIGAEQVGRFDNVRAGQVGTGNIGAGQVNQFASGTGPGGLGIGGMDLAGYTNPYQQQVIDQSDRDINRQSAITQQQNDGRAAMSGAFGGDRAAIVNTETQRNAADTMARTNAGLRSQNFMQAQGAATADINRQVGAGTQQAQLGLTADSTNQAAIMRAAQGNQQADLTAQQANQASGQRADVANQQAGLTASQANQAAIMRAAQGNQQADLAAQTTNQAAGQRSDVANQNANLTADTTNQAAILRALQGNQAADLTAQQANQASGQRSDVANQQAGLTAAQANQNAQLAADRSNQSSSLQSQQGNQFAGLQGQNLNMTGANALNGVFTADQATRQRADDAGYVDQSNRALWAQNDASWLLSQGQKLPYGSLTSQNGTSGTSTSGTTDSTGIANAPGPSALGQGISAAVAGAGLLGGLFGNGGNSSGGFGGLGGALGAAGSAAKSGYDYLTGGGSGAGSGLTDAFGGAGVNLGSTGASFGSDTSGLTDVFGGAGADGSSFLNFARGGIAGYADGGTVRHRGLPEPDMHVDTDAYDDTYAPVDGGRGASGTPYQANMGLGAMRDSSTPPAVADALAEPVPQMSEAPPPPAPAAAQAEPQYSPENPGPPDASLPVPPIPPQGGAPASVPTMAGAPQPTGIAAGMTTQPSPPTRPGTGQGIEALTGARAPNMLDRLHEGNNPLWLAMVQAGAAGMASGSHTALGALGAGLGAGATSLTQQAQQQRQQDATAALTQYRQGQLAVGQGRVTNGYDANTIRGNGQEQRQPLLDARVQALQAQGQAALARAQRQPGMSSGQVMDAAARDLMTSNPGMTYADAVGHMKGLDTRQQAVDQSGDRVAQGERRLGQGEQRLGQTAARDGATDIYRQQQVQLRATAAEDGAVRTRINAAAQMGKQLDYGTELLAVRATRQSAGPAPMPGQGTTGLRQAAGTPAAAPSAPVRVNSREEALALPPGAQFITPDGVTRTRPAQ